MHPDQPANPFELPPTSSRPKRPKLYGPGRPRTLDDVKRGEICALIAGGCGLREAAKYVHCSVNTIRREAERNPDFGQQLRHSETYAQLSPLRAMQQAVGTHWRAAAWFLERAFPERFARPDVGAFGARKARELMKEVVDIVRAEMFDVFKSDRVEKRIRGAFEYHIRMSCDQKRNSRSLRRAMEFFEDKNRVSGPLADLGIPTPDFSNFTNPVRTSPPAPRSTPNTKVRRDLNPSKRDADAGRGSQSVGRGSPDPAPHPTAGLKNNSAAPSSSPTQTTNQTDPFATTASSAEEFLKGMARCAQARAAKAPTPAPTNPNTQ